MKNTAVTVIVIMFIALSALGQETDLCNDPGPGFSWFSVESGPDGYRLNAPTRQMLSKTLGRALHLGRNMYTDAMSDGKLPDQQNFVEPGNHLAELGGVVLIAVGEGHRVGATTTSVPLGKVWNGTTPLECLLSFVKDAGLEVGVPEEGLWVVGPKEYIDNSAVVVTAYPFDENQVPLSKATLRTVLRKLPVRNWRSHVEDPEPKVLSLAMGYYRIPEEANTFLFVVTNSFTGGVPAVTGVGPTGMTFKVAIEGAGRDAIVTPLWCMPGIGELMTDFAEDLDGDGYRDFFFRGDERNALKLVPGDYNSLRSGKNGKALVPFLGSEVAIEKETNGARRIAVQGLFDAGIDGLDDTVILIYDEEQGKYVPEAGNNQSPEAKGEPHQNGEVGPAEALAAELGGPEHIVIRSAARKPLPSSRDHIAYQEGTGPKPEIHRSLWHLLAWNQGPGVLWRRLFEEGLPAPAEVVIQYIPEGYKRAYLEHLTVMAPPGYPIILPPELRPAQ